MDAILQLASANLLSPPVLFFILGFVGSIAGSQLTLPEAMAKTLSIYLMLAIGFKGGVALNAEGLSATLLLALVVGAILSAIIPIVAFIILQFVSKLPRVDAAAVAAHYGSISIVTFVAASQALEAIGLKPDGFMVAVAAVMETPAIIVALMLARGVRAKTRHNAGEEQEGLLKEVLLNSSIVVLMGAFIIGTITGQTGMQAVSGFIVVPFAGVLCLFLLDMGAVAGRGMGQGANVLNWRLVMFGLLMPFVGAIMALPMAWIAGLNAGSAAILLTLAASASYIAVPAALRIALPEARPSVYLTLSLGVTFPMNLTLGIPTYAALGIWVSGG
ncbi:MAG: sodium-dependent bicarbonate transport family permease [Ahrensia sp.]|nr:sodium-dependent bicarbonate transport family permease [Ahrensia sp.]